MSDHQKIEPPNVSAPERLTRDFFERPPEAVARDLIGVVLLYMGLGGTIVETEAYHPGDPASHSFRGQTLRNAAMFGRAGRAYVYRIYGMHWCLNFVCLPGSAVLIRAFQPEFGMQEMSERRGDMPPRLLASGPGRLCDALGISGADDGKSLLESPFELRANLKPQPVVTGPRIGITKAVAEPLRFGLEGSPYLSKKF